MKTINIIYWISTVLLSLMMFMSAYMYFTSPDVKGGFVHLGFPDFFRVELGIAKFLGAAALLIPIVPARIKEWAYFGFFVNFVSAIIAHAAVGDPVINVALPMVLLITSYVTYHKRVVAVK